MNIGSTRPPEGARGLLIAIGVLLALLAASLGLAYLLTQLTALVFPTLPAYFVLIYLVIALIPLMVLLGRLLPWMSNWYYLVPALVFLAAFTLYPIVLTVNFAFTNYSGQNSGQPDSSARSEIVQVAPDRRAVTVGAVGGAEETLEGIFRCESGQCAGRRAALYDEDGSQPVFAQVRAIEGSTVELAAPLAENFTPVAITRVNSIGYVGWENFRYIFAQASVQLLPIFAWTVVFAFSTIVLNAAAGMLLGILLNNRRLRFRNLYRSLLILPWAVPVVISVQFWNVLLNQNYGTMNRILGLLGASPVPWLTDPDWAKVSILLVNLWLGFPYMMTATISTLAAIPEDIYEAAEIDGASRVEQVRFITLPLLRSAFTPILLSGFAFNFNNFGIIYLLTQGGPPLAGRTATGQSTDILISWGYNTAFLSQGGANYAGASAIAVMIAILTVGISVFNFRAAGVFKETQR
ncbi:arabinogalactan oligomer/maltooligosaccharide transport system permease protein [Deinobacterium chartae]|uniref:Maltose/maltodextrin transport system permease protein n=1 Tax=Deinobacterium chartae TaxID=521158 RepID=A0A841HYN9_9DEIO|nr:ABC transporter permease subunit [Deinobacterium chartae]MBB6097058.1 arabinogalactan oligomer/maltooligosaccharide transport system permease protein [Deinobacterium chartae]